MYEAALYFFLDDQGKGRQALEDSCRQRLAPLFEEQLLL